MRFLSCISVGLFLLVLNTSSAGPTYPQWWLDEDIVASQPPPADGEIGYNSATWDAWMAGNYAPATLGQLKNFYTAAHSYLDGELPSGWDYSAEGQIVTAFRNNLLISTPYNYTPINNGQLKNTVKPLYDYLISIGVDTNQLLKDNGYDSGWAFDYPWDDNSANDANYAPANLGQLKIVFSIELPSGFLLGPPSANDTDGDKIGDDWEMTYFGNLTTVNGNPSLGALTDYDGDGLTDYDEYWGGSQPDSLDMTNVSLSVYITLE